VSVLGFLISCIYRALFLRGEEGFRAAHWASKLIFTSAALWLLACTRSPIPALYLTLLVAVLGLIDKGSEWVLAALTLSSIPAAWSSLTTLIMLLTGYSLTPAVLFNIFTRTLAISLAILFAASMISPTRLYNALYRLNLRGHAVIPIFTWRMVPYGLNTVVESLAIARVKGEKVYSRIAPAIASVIEFGDYVREACYIKLVGRPLYRIPVKTSKLHTLLLLTVAALVVVIAVTA